MTQSTPPGSGNERMRGFILLADGNVDDRFVTSMLLQRFGYNVCTATSEGDAMEYMSIALPILVVADVSPVGANGLGLLARMKKEARFADIPVIMASAQPSRAAEELARRGECSALLRKPLKTEELYRAVQAAVEKTPRRNVRISTSLGVALGDAIHPEQYATELSEYGMFLRTREPEPVKTRISLKLWIKDKTVRIDAVVLYSFSFEEGPFKEPGMGLKFVKIDPGDQALIRSFILDQLEQGLSRSK